MSEKEFNIDAGFEELDHILEALEKDQVKLADAVKLYTEGVSIVKKCKDSLDHVEKELIILEEGEQKNGL
ncbi:MAG: exodeoxyribonuclease VII small subunit [Anaerostipes sp.]|nr:exodeoxyribonuclease VII small subunit [Anaerostipes sp.]